MEFVADLSEKRAQHQPHFTEAFNHRNDFWYTNKFVARKDLQDWRFTLTCHYTISNNNNDKKSGDS